MASDQGRSLSNLEKQWAPNQTKKVQSGKPERARIVTIRSDRAGKPFCICASVASSAQVFVPPNLFQRISQSQVGATVYVSYVNGRKGHSNNFCTYISLSPVHETTHTWQAWQTGPTQIDLPDTVPDSDHANIQFGCFSCGSVLVGGHDIYKFKGGGVWTNALVSSVSVCSNLITNPIKRCTLRTVQCASCHSDVGSLYEEPYYDTDTCSLALGPFPRIKLTVAHGKLWRNASVLLGPENVVIETLSNLALEGTGRLRVSRVNQANYESVKSVEEALRAKEKAERALSELKTLQRLAPSEVGKEAGNKAAEEPEVVPSAVVGEWMCSTGEGDLPYSRDINLKLESAYASRAEVAFEARGQRYRIDWANSMQVNDSTGVRRPIIRIKVVKPKLNAAQVGSAAEWTTSISVEIKPGVTKRVVLAAELTSRHSLELQEFNFAASQFARLLNSSASKVTQVDIWNSAEAKKRFDDTACILGEYEAIWVFHGTKAANIENIMTSGFKVGGRDTDVVNGNSYGTGVYTAEGPGTPLAYSPDSKQLILAKASAGYNRNQTI